jgi:hypothetical protein
MRQFPQPLTTTIPSSDRRRNGEIDAMVTAE